MNRMFTAYNGAVLAHGDEAFALAKGLLYASVKTDSALINDSLRNGKDFPCDDVQSVLRPQVAVNQHITPPYTVR